MQDFNKLMAVAEAAQKVLDGLNQRIEEAAPDAVPVFTGIVELHDALGRLNAD